MAQNAVSTDAQSEREVVITRLLKAPRELVFNMWTDPHHISQWFGPRGFTTTFNGDIRPGGTFRLVMHSSEGLDYPMTGIYHEVVEPERLVYTQDLTEHPPEWHDALNSIHPDGKLNPESTTTVTFEEQEGGTKLTITTLFVTAGDREAMEKLGMNEGWNETLDRLVEHLGTV